MPTDWEDWYREEYGEEYDEHGADRQKEESWWDKQLRWKREAESDRRRREAIEKMEKEGGCPA